MSYQNYLEQILTISKCIKGESVYKKYNNKLYSDIIENVYGLSFKEKLYNIKHNILENPKCQNIDCSNNVIFALSYNRYKKACSDECAKILMSYNKLIFSDNKKLEIQNKRKNTCINKYGVDNVAKNDKVQNKIEATNIIKYGYKSPTQNKDILLLREQNNIVKTGYAYHIQNPINQPSMIKKRKETINNQIINKYKSLGLNVLDFKDGDITCLCGKCNKMYTTLLHIVYQRIKYKINTCILCCPIGSFKESQFQKSIAEFLKLQNINIEICNTKLLGGKELDIYIPELKLGIECNGIYWHNELNRPKLYHRNKYILAKEKGIELIQIWQDDWRYKSDIIMSKLLSKVNKTIKIIGSRKCIIKEVNFNDTRIFLNNNHLLGHVPSKLNYGLYYNNELISLMTFSKSRINNENKNSYELLRYCNKLNHTIVGGANKLYQYFLHHNNPQNVISYVNLEWNEDNCYRKLGFIKLKDTNIVYSYVYKGIKRHRFNFRKDILVKQGFDKNKTEHEIMLDRKIYRVYNTGNAIWSWSNNI